MRFKGCVFYERVDGLSTGILEASLDMSHLDILWDNKVRTATTNKTLNKLNIKFNVS
jgi:hypothetical protein